MISLHDILFLQEEVVFWTTQTHLLFLCFQGLLRSHQSNEIAFIQVNQTRLIFRLDSQHHITRIYTRIYLLGFYFIFFARHKVIVSLYTLCKIFQRDIIYISYYLVSFLTEFILLKLVPILSKKSKEGRMILYLLKLLVLIKYAAAGICFELCRQLHNRLVNDLDSPIRQIGIHARIQYSRFLSFWCVRVFVI